MVALRKALSFLCFWSATTRFTTLACSALSSVTRTSSPERQNPSRDLSRDNQNQSRDAIRSSSILGFVSASSFAWCSDFGFLASITTRCRDCSFTAGSMVGTSASSGDSDPSPGLLATSPLVFRPPSSYSLSSTLPSSPSPMSRAGGKRKAPSPTPPAAEAGLDYWIYLRSQPCRDLIATFDNSFTEHVPNHRKVAKLITVAAPQLIKHVEAWENADDSVTHGFLYRARKVVRFILRLYPDVSVLQKVLELIPKEMPPGDIPDQHFVIPDIPRVISVDDDSSDEEDGDDDAEEDVPEDRGSSRASKRARLDDDSFEEAEVIPSTGKPPPRTRSSKTAAPKKAVAKLTPAPKPTPVVKTKKVHLATMRYQYTPDSQRIKEPPPAKASTSANKPKPTPAKKASPEKVVPEKSSPDKSSPDKPARLRKHPKPPIEGTTATATMVIPTIKVESSLINPDDVEAPFACSNCAGSGIGETCVFLGFRRACLNCTNAHHINRTLDRLIQTRRQADFHTALGQLYLDDYLDLSEDLAYLMLRNSAIISREALEARFTDVSALDALNIFFERLGYTRENIEQYYRDRHPPATVMAQPSTTGYPDDDHSRYTPTEERTYDMPSLLYSSLETTAGDFDKKHHRSHYLSTAERAHWKAPSPRGFSAQRVSQETFDLDFSAEASSSHEIERVGPPSKPSKSSRKAASSSYQPQRMQPQAQRHRAVPPAAPEPLEYTASNPPSYDPANPQSLSRVASAYAELSSSVDPVSSSMLNAFMPDGTIAPLQTQNNYSGPAQVSSHDKILSRVSTPSPDNDEVMMQVDHSSPPVEGMQDAASDEDEGDNAPQRS
ncbi:hypothetical protein C8J57DRAFT_1254222 [Mycena rebaudengoi]|nr:hypothetical protein C8J57DRAFT_1254222 [Mycena rebaudengoi]